MLGLRSPRFFSLLLTLGVLSALAPNVARADFVLPGWARSTPGTTYQQWDVFGTADGSTPNLPDVGVYNPAAPAGAGLNVYDSSGTSFLTSDGNIYSYSAPTDIHITVPNYNLGGGYYTTVILQTRTQGSEIDYGHVAIGDVAPLATAELYRLAQSTPFGPSYTVDMWYEWVLPGNVAGYTLDIPASGSSMSFDRAVVDTRASLVGDVNNDGVVNGLDIGAIASHWLSTGTIGSLAGDANFDGVVNGLDIAQVAGHWLSTSNLGGGSGAQIAAVPEPSSLSLLAGSALLYGVCRMRRSRDASLPRLGAKQTHGSTP